VGDGPVGLTVLYDADCGLCRWVREWLEGKALLVPLAFVPLGSPLARAKFPALDHDRTRDEVTVVSDDGAVYRAEAAWIACLWATSEHRGLAHWLSGSRRRAGARHVALALAARTSARGRPADCTAPGTGPGAGGEGYGDRCAR
jgi:predicted DCC family thiol-disulfide oxidoreductase YuxK